MSNDTAIGRDDTNWLGMEAPRYTSYPSAHHFSSQVNKDQHSQWLGAIGNKTSISVYVHIPFCRELCWFCGCHTKMTKRYEPISKYVQLLLKEIELLKQHVGSSGKLVNIHFGGGSPSLLEPDDLLAILHAISSVFEFTPPGELAIELDPRTTTLENIALYASLGFNRVSIGIQDFDPAVQQAINRIQPYPMVASIMQQIGKAGIKNINCDLIYGLPQQTLERFRTTLEKTIALNPSRIALFSYAHMPQVKKHQRMIDAEQLPSEPEKLALYALASEMLSTSGYVPIGIDHFAKPDDSLAIAMGKHSLKRNFQGYVTDATDVLIGLGSSAISQFPEGYVQNSADAVDYKNKIENNQLPSARGWNFKGDDLVRKRVIDELMCFMSADLAKIRRVFHLDEHYFTPDLDLLRQEQCHKIVALDKDRVRITTPYRMAARVVASVFDQYRGLAAGRYSKVA